MTKVKYRFEQSASADTHRLYIYDDVTAQGPFNWDTWEFEKSETGADYFREQLDAIPETDTIELHVNSNGGSVKEGIAIYNLLKQHGAKKTCYVDGFAFSVASVICMACDKIIMGLGTSMLIHNMTMCVDGNAAFLRKCADDLDTLMESNRKIYMARAKNLTEEQLIEMMDRETFLTPEQCLEYGFCDEIGPEPQTGQSRQQATEQALEQALRKMQELRQQLDCVQSFRQEMKLFAGGSTPVPAEPFPAGRQVPENGIAPAQNKLLKMAEAFLKSFPKEDKTK